MRHRSTPRPREDSARLAELARNVDELKKLQGATAAAAPARLAPAAPAPAAAARADPCLRRPWWPPAPPRAAARRPPRRASSGAAASAPVAWRPGPAGPGARAEARLLDSLLENPLLLPGVGVLVALLAGLGLYRLRGRRKQAGETSFLESRLQPDSFFGASGGQRIDTRDATSSAQSSSMNYSLSQLDAIGDVDPVAEADVYLAYGRDLQAEEILKEAMRANPERMAIRTKLLRGLRQAPRHQGLRVAGHADVQPDLRRGRGLEKGAGTRPGIDPENELYRPGRPARRKGALRAGDGAGRLRGLDAALHRPGAAAGLPAGARRHARCPVDGELDLELELPGHAAAPVSAPVPFAESTQALGTQVPDGRRRPVT
ncbi:MAG: hypothetical protein IPF94_10550 [Betaproteobacteria bacterium]|nr:hypothetical protein [Betaproteobacteria bacterium]